ncbi:MAG: M28 family metallopeptidase [Longimicrobiales bacterium]
MAKSDDYIARPLVWILALLLISACDSGGEVDTDNGFAPYADPAVAEALAAIEPGVIEAHIRVLADDNLEGRAPGTAGYEGASRYVEQHLVSLGLQAAGDGGAFRQAVPLQQSVVDESASQLSISGPNGMASFSYAVDFTLSPNSVRPEVTVTAPVVFVGYGVSAPALGYDDYADIDVNGKVVAYLTGAPPALPSNQRAYYSSGTVKGEEAANRGAVGMIGFTYPEDPRFRWDVGVARSRRGAFAWLDGDGAPRGRGGESPIQASANLNHSVAQALFADAPTAIEDVFANGAASTPQAFDLGVDITVRTVSEHRQVSSHNLVGRLEGSDPQLRDEHVVFVSHIDHFGVGDAVEGDSIYNGAHDNASGTAIVMEIARAFASLPQTPSRSVLFLFVTAEEWGLLGSDYFVHHPTVPGASLVANLALDMPFLFHPLLDIVPYGAEHSSLADAVGAAADHLGIAIGPDPIPEQVLFIRSDHYSFVRQGVPALFIKSGFETGDDRDGGAINTAFRRERYHTPSDESDQGFDFGAGVAHARVNFLTGYYVAMDRERPTWNEGDFFGGIFGPETR